MHQLDIWISGKCEKWQNEVAKLNALLARNEVELEQVSSSFKQKLTEVGEH